MLTERLMELTLIGGTEWVMILLILLSVASIAVMFERALFFRRKGRALQALDERLFPLIEASDVQGISNIVKDADLPALRAAAGAPRNTEPAVLEKRVLSALSRERLYLERRLAFLGTLGNNAPFIGLLGTVIGIIRAFNDLSLEQMKGTSAVMAGISEALVATAIGLFVAIPAVIAFNFFQRQVDRSLSTTEALAQGIIAVHCGHAAKDS